MASHLRARPAPINYARRRHLDYRELLPERCWDQLRRPLGIRPHTSQRRRWAQQWLFERLTATPADHAPSNFAITNPQQRAQLANHNTTKLTPGLVSALDAHGRDFLRRHGITNEPLTWQPPTALLDGLHLPGPDPELIDIARLHQLVREQQLTPRDAARRLHTTIDAVRYVLDQHPPPTPLPDRWSPRRAELAT